MKPTINVPADKLARLVEMAEKWKQHINEVKA